MTKMPLKFIHRFADRHGKVRYYLRRPGFKVVPLTGEPLSEEFMGAYREALAGQPTAGEPRLKRVAPGCVHAAVAGYLRSAEFLRLAKGTQRARRGIYRRLQREKGEKRVAMLERRHVLQMLAERAETPWAADHFLGAVKRLLAWCVTEGLRKDNPAEGLKSPRPRTNGYIPWEEEHIALYREAHDLGTKPRLALELLLNMGVRRGDVVRVGRQHIRSGIISMRTQKGGVQIDIPVLPELQAALDAMPPSGHLTFMATAYGAGRTANGFGNWFATQCRAAKVPKGYSAHGLRKASATRLADNGATAHQLMAWFGWLNIKEAELYTRRADRRRLSLEAGKLATGTSSGKP